MENDVNYEFEAHHKWNDVLLAYMILVRVFFVLRFLMGLSYFMSSRAQRVSMMNGHDAGMSFAMKCLMKDSPMKVLGTNLLLSILIFGYSIRIFDQ